MMGSKVLEDAFMHLGSVGPKGAGLMGMMRKGIGEAAGVGRGPLIAAGARRNLVSMGRRRAMIGGAALGGGAMLRRSSGTRGLQGRSSGGNMY